MIKLLSLILLVLFAITTNSFGQYQTTSQTRIGLALETTFSSLNYNGLTPYLTLGNDCHEFQVGTRLNFNKLIGQEANNPQRFVIDLGYRIVFFNKIKWLQLYGIFKTEYGFNRETDNWHYTVPEEEDLESLYLGSSSFNAHSDIKSHTINFHLGLGAEVGLTNDLYLKTDASLGVGGNTLKRTYTNVETNENVLNSMMLFGNRKMSWMLSAGIGYRFGSTNNYRR